MFQVLRLSQFFVSVELSNQFGLQTSNSRLAIPGPDMPAQSVAAGLDFCTHVKSPYYKDVTHFIFVQDCWDQLVYLQKRNIFADARSVATSKLN